MLTFPPDYTFVVQLVTFFVLWLGLKRLLFDPVLQVIEQREARTVGAQQAAAALRGTADAAAAEYDRRMREVRHAVSQETEAARVATQAEERRTLATARSAAGAELAQLRERLSAQAQAARPGLTSEARALAAQVLAQVTGRPAA